MSVIEMSEKGRMWYVEVVEDVYTSAAQAMVLAMVEKNFILRLRVFDWTAIGLIRLDFGR